jgi:lipid-binding SYLF domain-containing protein
MRTRRPAGIFAAALLLLGLAAGCAGPSGDTADARRQTVQSMRQDTLAKLYQLRPEVRTAIERAEGYAVFSSIGVNVVFVAYADGWGVVRDNKSGKDVYMKMAGGGIGPGLGVKDFRAVFVFNTRQAFDDFVTKGWDATASADAAAKSSTKGAAASTAGTIGTPVDIYQITEAGIAAQATISGTRYWRDDELG